VGAHHCNSQFGSVVISDSRWGDSATESSEGLRTSQDDLMNDKGRSYNRKREMERRFADWRMRSPSEEAGIMINLMADLYRHEAGNG
jgi:hypothetical protein